MLSKLDKDATVLLQHLQGALGASLVARLEDGLFFVGVFNQCSLVQRSAVTNAPLAIVQSPILILRLLVDADGEATNHAPAALHGLVCLFNVVDECKRRDATYGDAR